MNTVLARARLLGPAHSFVTRTSERWLSPAATRIRSCSSGIGMLVSNARRMINIAYLLYISSPLAYHTIVHIRNAECAPHGMRQHYPDRLTRSHKSARSHPWSRADTGSYRMGLPPSPLLWLCRRHATCCGAVNRAPTPLHAQREGRLALEDAARLVVLLSPALDLVLLLPASTEQHEQYF